MNSFRSNRLAHLVLLTAVSAAAAEAGATSDTSGAQTASGDVPSSNEPTAETKVRAPKDPAKALDILNGRMPLPIVYAIRFQEDAGAKNSELAKKYGTSVGKVFDIRKGSNFSYITKDYRPSAEELAAARAHITTGTSAKGSNLKALGGNPEAIEAFLAAQTVATPEQVAARGWVIKQVGVAKPKAQGQEITRMEIAMEKANSTVAPIASQIPPARMAMAITAGTNTPATLSAIWAIGALELLASSTS